MAKIYVPDIECDSCIRLISKKLKDSNIHDFRCQNDCVELADSSHKEKVIGIIKSLGYRASDSPFERKTLSERIRHISENPQKYAVETKGLMYSIFIFISLAGLFLISYFGFLKNIPNFMANYGWWMLYLIISITALGFGLWHFHAYKARVTCMAGMMIGMTFGMQTGMMIGAIIGATNGFFVGAMAGMLLGVFTGIITGKCCGIMGVMEGMMAGVMGGTMGSMISVMMLFDNLLIFMPFYMIINVAIIAGLSYMFYEEVVEKDNGVKRKPVDFAVLASASVIIFFLISIIMIYGPKSSIIPV